MKKRRAIFGADEFAFLKKNRRMRRSQLHELFVKQFSRPDVTLSGLEYLMKKKGWRSEAFGSIRYSEDELRFLAENSQMYRKDLLPLFVEKFNRSDMTIDRLNCICKYHRIKTGRHRSVKEIGAEFNSSAGIYVRVGERSHLGRQNYILKHKLLWQQKNGPVPKGCALKCLDSNKLNTDPSNWACVPNGVLSRLGKRKFESAPLALRPAIMAVARLEHAAARAAARSPIHEER
jgi:hypothetical protein